MLYDDFSFFLFNHKILGSVTSTCCAFSSLCVRLWLEVSGLSELPDTLNSLAMFSIKRQLAHKVDSNDFAAKKVCASYSYTHNLYFSMQMKADIIVLLVRKT